MKTHCLPCSSAFVVYGQFTNRDSIRLPAVGSVNGMQSLFMIWTKLFPADLPKLPQQCPLPFDRAICEWGKRPTCLSTLITHKGQIVGSSSLCPEDSCPEDLLCRACADSLRECQNARTLSPSKSHRTVGAKVLKASSSLQL